MSFLSRSIAAACILPLAWSCAIAEETDARVADVEPAFCYEGEPAEITITGEGFAVDASRDVGCGGAPLTLEDDYAGELGGEALDDVVWIDDQTLTAHVPGTLDVGRHDLVVVTPSGETVALEDAFEVREAGSDADSDTDADADADTDEDDGVECESALVVELLPTAWEGAWADFYSSFAPTNECGTGNADVWFEVMIPAGGHTLRVEEGSATDVLVRHVAGCGDWSCVDYSDEPEALEIAGGAEGGWVYVVITEIDGAYHPDGAATFDLVD